MIIKALQQTAVATLVLESSLSLSAAAAAELFRSATGRNLAMNIKLTDLTVLSYLPMTVASTPVCW